MRNRFSSPLGAQGDCIVITVILLLYLEMSFFATKNKKIKTRDLSFIFPMLIGKSYNSLRISCGQSR